ncbi:hypothetical protein [Nitrosospira sp. Nsp13]|uniref:hypothetical protein n=1 Tax=Nitrosospira sp. Nsp13 TaxID=1855332 RepID=UPI000886B641|nr:hypothetical protein [Nitrosospira sp. Nsp13]SCX82172.1 hypothetical protein SAMN05216308_101421 [Nitrosospira sp. Nsp13]
MLVEDASEFDLPGKEKRAGEVVADVSRGSRGALESNQRALERSGVNPNSGRFQALTQDINLAWLDTDGAMNRARRDTESLLGVSEINISVKTVDKAGRFFRLPGTVMSRMV